MNGPKSVTASFTPYYPLTVLVNGSGAVEAIPPGGSHLLGTVVTLTATAGPGWAFTSWSGAVSGTANPRTITVNGPRTVTANFTRLFSLTVVPSPGGSVVASPAGGSHPAGTLVTLTAAPSAGFAFTGWGGALSGSVNPASLVMGSDATVSASFTALYTLVATATSGGSVSVSPPGSTHLAGTVLTFSATPEAGFVFTGWSGALSGAANPATLALTGSASVTASFAPLYSLAATATEGGQVNVEPPDGSYPSGTVVTLTATPDAGFEFDGWSGDLAGPANPSPLTMDHDKQVTAVFAAPEPSQALLVTGALILVRWLARAASPSRRRRSRDTQGAPARTT
jgi:hypothetical protein